MTPREIRFAIDGLTGIVVVSVAGALAVLTWRVAGDGGSTASVSAAMSAYVPPAPAPDITAMVNLPPFGKAVIVPAGGTAPADLILHGVLLANPANQSTALIATTGQKSIAYRIGEPLPNGATLERIGVDYVTLRVGGQFANLYFPDDERAGKAPAPGAPGAPAGSTDAGFAAARALLPPSLTSPRPSAPGPGSASAQPAPPPPPPPPPQQPPAAAPPQQISGNGNGLIDSLGATVTPQGYRVGSALSPQMRSAGLQPGDVVASVNGVSAATLAADQRRLAQTMAGGPARVEVVRGGTRITLSVPVR